MSLSARRVLRPACRISVLPSPRLAVITEPAEHVEPVVSKVSRTSHVEHALINGAENTVDQYVKPCHISQCIYFI